jgi:hypothetical protein
MDPKSGDDETEQLWSWIQNIRGHHFGGGRRPWLLVRVNREQGLFHLL